MWIRVDETLINLDDTSKILTDQNTFGTGISVQAQMTNGDRRILAVLSTRDKAKKFLNNMYDAIERDLKIVDVANLRDLAEK